MTIFDSTEECNGIFAITDEMMLFINSDLTTIWHGELEVICYNPVIRATLFKAIHPPSSVLFQERGDRASDESGKVIERNGIPVP